METLLSQLNESQRAAVEYNEGPQLIIAGAGAGKTRVLTYKIAYLLRQGIPSYSILALTFTNKAAREMKERITALVPAQDAKYLWMGTFHSICARILRQETSFFGFTRDFSIYDTTDSKSLIKQICKEYDLDDKIYKPATVLGRISAAKNALILPDEYAQNKDFSLSDKNERLYKMAEVYATYQARLKAANAMDFDDLLVYMCLLLQRNEEARTRYQLSFRYILVDEYQDTNYAQYLIVKLLAEPDNHIAVVGDDAQSIYSFRGADIRNILTFQRGYSNAKLFKLERNYRSTRNIVNAANSLIQHNENQIRKEVYSEKEQGDKLSLTAYLSDREEALGVATEVRRNSTAKKVSYNDIAVLYRTNAQSRSLENEFRKLNIPYRIYGGISFYQRKEIKDAIGYFRLAANDKDNEALLRVINLPARGIGETTMRKVSECSIAANVSMYQVICDPATYQLSVSAATAKKLTLFGELMERFKTYIDTCDAFTFADKIMHESGIMTAAAIDRTPEGIERLQNLEELLNGIKELVEQRTRDGISFTPIYDFLNEVSLLTDQDQNLTDYSERVTLMTVHAAKGLEFKYVFVVGLEENLFPSQYCRSNREIEEERRLLYVAITRAMEKCYLTYARQRFKNGAVNFSSPSRFLEDIDRQYLEKSEGGVPSQPPESRFPSPYNFFNARQYQPSSSQSGSYLQAPQQTTPSASLTRLTSSPSAAKVVSSDDYPEGSRIRHRVFGEGMVMQVYIDNDNEKIDILFDGPGKKTLLLMYAKLEKL